MNLAYVKTEISNFICCYRCGQKATFIEGSQFYGSPEEQMKWMGFFETVDHKGDPAVICRRCSERHGERPESDFWPLLTFHVLLRCNTCGQVPIVADSCGAMVSLPFIEQVNKGLLEAGWTQQIFKTDSALKYEGAVCPACSKK